MYEKLVERLTVPVRMMLGGILLLSGIVWQVLSGKILDMYAFYMMAAAMLCFTHVIISKLSKGSFDPVKYILFNMLVLIVGFAITESDKLDGVVLYTLWLGCLLADWVINAVLLDCEGAAKRGVMGFAAMFLNILLIGAVFMIPVLAAAFQRS